MNIQLIDYTGHGHPDPARRAAELLVYTKNTRLEQGEATVDKIANMREEELVSELEYISNTIRSSWEFIDYTVQITGVTRAFTHQLVRTRTASYAQQSQRSVEMNGFTAEMPESIHGDLDRELIWDRQIQSTQARYDALIQMGVPTEDARGLLPTNIHTNIIMKANLRTMADLVGKRINPRAQGEYTEFMRKTSEAILEVHPWARFFLYPERLSTPALDALLKEALGEATPVSKPKINAALKELDKMKGVWG